MIHSFKVCVLFSIYRDCYYYFTSILPTRHALTSTTQPTPTRPPSQEAPSEVSAVSRSLRRAPREQLAGCRERGSSKGARSRMLRAKECKQVEPLHYMARPPHSHAPPPTVSFYVDVDYTHKHTNTHTKPYSPLHSTTTVFCC